MTTDGATRFVGCNVVISIRVVFWTLPGTERTITWYSDRRALCLVYPVVAKRDYDRLMWWETAAIGQCAER